MGTMRTCDTSWRTISDGACSGVTPREALAWNAVGAPEQAIRQIQTVNVERRHSALVQGCLHGRHGGTAGLGIEPCGIGRTRHCH